ncbi:hypothetical protein R6242_12760 [Iodobacter sp. CM08]|uniref:hypothetical protein n=1 Tax=Iodobacter sp. CM08 TaxID=3085902 RepID=UPI0029827CB7|nr:hypothetical protein [Iodobacter sp. CM08]MDW5417437.1 hypothetical protein [Iodobacter sp. CM08]
MKLKLFCILALVSTSLMAEPAPNGRPDYNGDQGNGVGGQGGYNGGSGSRPDYNEGNHGSSARPDYNNGHDHQAGSRRKIFILQATYGARGGRCDFTRKLARSANDKSSYRFRAGNQWCGDPSDGYQKMATIEYSCGGYKKRAFVREGQSEMLRCN